MDLDLTDEQRELRDLVTSFFATESPTEVVRVAEPLGFDPALWQRLTALGVPEMAAEAGLFELALVAEAAGRHLAPVPVVETLVATRLLATFDHKAGNSEEIPTLALRPAAPDGVATLVPAGVAATTVVGLDGDDLVAVQAQGSAERISPHNLGSAPLADVDLRAADRRLLASGAGAHAAFTRALDDWRVLTAAALSGLAAGALATAVGYVTERHAFGVPVGSFQSVQHHLADIATDNDGARLLAAHAARSSDPATNDDEPDQDHPDRAWLPLAALRFATQAARSAAGWGLHFHGGYGYMVEYDPQLYLRRATAWPLALADPAVELDRLARRWLERPTRTSQDTEVADFLDTHLTDGIVERVHDDGTLHDWGLHAAMAERGYLAASWPTERGGQARDPLQMWALIDELTRRGAPIDGWLTSDVVAHILDITGSEHQRGEVVAEILSGRALVCLGYTEPECGSDVAAARTRAVRDGEDWVINGQKMFTTLAHSSAYILLLTRTDPGVAKHRGLTMFLVPMDTPGIEVQPIATLGGERTNVTFLTDVRVPDSCRVGEVDGGWRVMAVALAFERELTSHSDAVRLLAQGEAWARRAGRTDDPLVRRRLAAAAVDNEVGRLLGHRLNQLATAGQPPVVEGSMAKLFCSEALQRNVAELLDMLGPAGVLAHGAPGAPADGWIEQGFRHAQVMTIRAGTSEVQRSIIAERGLGLPRSR